MLWCKVLTSILISGSKDSQADQGQGESDGAGGFEGMGVVKGIELWWWWWWR